MTDDPLAALDLNDRMDLLLALTNAIEHATKLGPGRGEPEAQIADWRALVERIDALDESEDDSP